MARPLVTDALWAEVAPLLPEPRTPSRQGGRPRIDDRTCLEGILFVLKTGLPWEELPPQFGCSGMTCWRRLNAWRRAGVWEAIWRKFLDELGREDAIDWSAAIVDSSSTRAVLGGSSPAPTPRTADASARNAT
jgi:transposase